MLHARSYFNRAMLLLLAAVILVGSGFIACNDHRFTPLTNIQVLPKKLKYENPMRDQVNQEFAVSNLSISAGLKVFEIGFEDSKKNALAFSKASDEFLSDQADYLADLVTELEDGTAVSYDYMPKKIVSDLPCQTNSHCHPGTGGGQSCSPETAGSARLMEEGDEEENEEYIFPEARLGEGFICEEDPLNRSKDSIPTGKVCQRYFDTYNNSNNVTAYQWGGKFLFKNINTVDCTSDAQCPENAHCHTQADAEGNTADQGRCFAQGLWAAMDATDYEEGYQTVSCNTDADCEDVARAAKLPGYEYVKCLPETAGDAGDDVAKICRSDIKFDLSVEYMVDRLAILDESVISNRDNAATWVGVGDMALCLADESDIATDEETPEARALRARPMATDMTFYGLNRCDQIALKRKLADIFDGDETTGFKLSNSGEANLRIMQSELVGLETQSKYVAYCDSGDKLRKSDQIYPKDPGFDPANPADVTECYTGEVDSEGLMILDDSKLSVNIDALKLDQLPLRILYQVDDTYPGADVLSGKNFTLTVEHSAKIGGTQPRQITLDFKQNQGGPPVPYFELGEDYDAPEPLDVVTLDARKSCSPFGDERKPFDYWWEWGANSPPQGATDSTLICPNCSFDMPISIMGSWTDHALPKINFPVAGRYSLKLKVRDSAGVASGDKDTQEFFERAIDVRPSERIHVELIWTKGDEVDLDLFLVRYRDAGTFAISGAVRDLLAPTREATSSSCTTDADCPGNFPCGGNGFCDLSCTTDAECKEGDFGWYCNQDLGECDVRAVGSLKYIQCESDADCGGLGYCNPAQIGTTGTSLVCTQHTEQSINDTCFFDNVRPRWGYYIEDIAPACGSDDDCNGIEDNFTCNGGTCDLACDNSAQCIDANPQYLCSPDTGSCMANSTDDDPSLDIDDVDGWGPENISLDKPETGRYRVVARLFADPNKVLATENPNDMTPNRAVKAIVQIYLNGELTMEKGIGHEMIDDITYWKVADILWEAEAGDIDPDSGEFEGQGAAIPLCAGWTTEACTTLGSSEECGQWFPVDSALERLGYSEEEITDMGYDYQFTCQERVWPGKYCSTCQDAPGNPEECNPSKPCLTNDDCADEPTSKYCQEIKGNYCRCGDGVADNIFPDFEEDHYANPFLKTTGTGIFDPDAGSLPRSIWCDRPNTVYDGVNQCSQLYAE